MLSILDAPRSAMGLLGRQILISSGFPVPLVLLKPQGLAVAFNLRLHLVDRRHPVQRTQLALPEVVADERSCFAE